MNNDNELGAPIGADGQELTAEQAKAEIEETTRIVAFKSDEGSTFKGKIDLLKLRKFHDRIYGLAQYDCAKKAGFAENELDKIGEIQANAPDDPRLEKLLDLQATSTKLARAEATIAHDVFVSWNVPAPAPTVEDLMQKGGVYDSFVEAVTSKYGPTARRSEAGAATVSPALTDEPAS